MVSPDTNAIDTLLRRAGLPAQSPPSAQGPASRRQPIVGEQEQVVETGVAGTPPTSPASGAAGPPRAETPAGGFEDLPPLANPEEVIELFNRQHGRSPTVPETRAIRLVPVLTAQLGRRPLRAELLAAMDSRSETPVQAPTQFREVVQEAQSGPGAAA